MESKEYKEREEYSIKSERKQEKEEKEDDEEEKNSLQVDISSNLLKKNELKSSKYTSNDYKLLGKGGAVAFTRKTNNSKGIPPSSPTDSMLSPCTKKLRRKQSKKLTNDTISLDFWVPPDNIDLILGSSSSSRAQILVDLGWDFKVVTPDIDETLINCDDPFRLPILIAKEKAKAILLKIPDLENPTVIITCDQIVFYRHEIRNKPLNRIQAKQYLLSYQPNEIVQTITAVVATHYPSGKQSSDIDISTIYWTGIPEDIIDNVLLNKEEIYNSCGGFLIEDQDFLNHVDHIDGEIDSIRGLPIKLTKKVVRAVISTDI